MGGYSCRESSVDRGQVLSPHEVSVVGRVRDGDEMASAIPLAVRSLPALPNLEPRLTTAVAAIEGVISYAVFETRDLLEDWFLDDLVTLATRFLVAA